MLKSVGKIIFASFLLGLTALFVHGESDFKQILFGSRDGEGGHLPIERIYQTIRLSQLLQMKRNKLNLIIDVREKRRFDYGRIPLSLNIPLKEMEFISADRLNFLKKAPNIILYCLSESCDSAELSAVILYGKGVKNLSVYKGGWVEWKSCGLPLEGKVAWKR